MAKSLSLTLTSGKDNVVTINESSAGAPSAYKFWHSNRTNGPFVQVTTTFAVSGGKITFTLPTAVVNAFGEQEYYQVTRDADVAYVGSIYVNNPPVSNTPVTPTPTDLSNYYNKSEVDAKVATKTTDSTITTTGRNVITAATAAAARTAIGAGTSNLAIGTTSTTAKAGDYAPAIADVNGLTAALAAKGAGTVKTVNNNAPDANGNVDTPANWFAERSTSTCQTIPFGLGNGSNTLLGGTVSAGLVINKATKTYTSARFFYLSQTTAPTDLYVGVWDTNGTLLAATGTIVPTVASLCSGTLTTPLTLAAGQNVFVGLAVIGGSAPAFLRYSYANALTGVATALPTLQPTRLSWTMSGNTAGSATPPNLTGTSQTSILYWVELY
jgi:hypothetical protein